MRVIAYNILDGGEGRADPIAEVIEAQRADVVVLVEAEELSVVERIASRGGMDFIVGMASSRGGAILSRWPIIASINHAAMVDLPFNCFLEARIADPSGVEWPVVA